MCWIITLSILVLGFTAYYVYWAATHPPDAKLEVIAGGWYIVAVILFVGIMLGLVWLVKVGW